MTCPGSSTLPADSRRREHCRERRNGRSFGGHIGRGDEPFDAIEEAGPTGGSIVAPFGGREVLVYEYQKRLVASWFERDRDGRAAPRSSVRAIEGFGHHQMMGRIDFEVFAGFHVRLLARRAELDAIAATDAHIELDDAHDVVGTVPVPRLHGFACGPRVEK